MTRKRYASVHGAIADTPQRAMNLRLRVKVMQRIERKGCVSTKLCSITQRRAVSE